MFLQVGAGGLRSVSDGLGLIIKVVARGIGLKEMRALLLRKTRIRKEVESRGGRKLNRRLKKYVITANEKANAVGASTSALSVLL